MTSRPVRLLQSTGYDARYTVDREGCLPYLRLTCPELTAPRRVDVALRLTEALVELFFDPRARLTRDDLRERTTVHFVPYRSGELFVGGQTPDARGAVDLTAELSDWSMSVRQQRRIARALTPLLATLFGVPPDGVDGINIRFHSYPPTDFAVGGRLLSDRVPRIGQVMKRFAG